MKKIFALVLTFVMFFACFSVPAHASESNAIIPRSSSYSGIMDGGVSASFIIDNVMANPTFTFSISGNTSLYVDVYIEKGPGITAEQYLMRNILCDGTEHTVSFSNLSTGRYQFKVIVNHGSTWGEDKSFTMKVTY